MGLKWLIMIVFFVAGFNTRASIIRNVCQEPEKKVENKSKVENNNTTRPYRRKQAPSSSVKKEKKSKQ